MAELCNVNWTTSKIAPALKAMLDEAPDPLPGESPCRLQQAKACPFKPGIENLFVSLTAHRVVEYLRGTHKTLTFQDVIYCPHTRAEDGGFDLSVGNYWRHPRVRSMHKLASLQWCDESWRWKHNPKQNKKDQVALLLKAYDEPENRQQYEPFLIIHVCHCIHEFRRMGRPRIPDIDDPRRTVIVDLKSIVRMTNWKQPVEQGDYKLSVTFDPNAPQSLDASIALGKGSPDTLEVLSFGEYLTHVASRTTGP